MELANWEKIVKSSLEIDQTMELVNQLGKFCFKL